MRRNQNFNFVKKELFREVEQDRCSEKFLKNQLSQILLYSEAASTKGFLTCF